MDTGKSYWFFVVGSNGDTLILANNHLDAIRRAERRTGRYSIGKVSSVVKQWDANN